MEIGPATTLHGTTMLPFVIPRARDFFDLFVFSAYPTSFISSLDKAVILSEALRRSIVNRGLYGAESKDPGDACWQMLLGAFWTQTTTEDKKVTNSERSRGICSSADPSWKRFSTERTRISYHAELATSAHEDCQRQQVRQKVWGSAGQRSAFAQPFQAPRIRRRKTSSPVW
jgi:hypothetical protein